MKKTSKAIQEIITLGIYLIILPILGYISFMIYNNMVLPNGSNQFISIVFIAIIILINLCVIFALNYFIKNVKREFFIINGIAINAILGFLYKYYQYVEGLNCNFDASKCILYMNNSNILKCVLILGVTYVILYIIIYNMVNIIKRPSNFNLKG